MSKDSSKSVDYVVPTVPGTPIGGHDIHGADGETRTERAGEILGTPDLTLVDTDHRDAARKRETERADFVAEEVDRANREDLPKLGGNVELDNWKAEKGGSPASPAAKAGEK